LVGASSAMLLRGKCRGMSRRPTRRRVENPTEPSSSVDAKKKDMAPAPLPSIDAELTDGPKH
jgi:hypothetical protein